MNSSTRASILLVVSLLTLISCAGKRPPVSEVKPGLAGEITKSIEGFDRVSYPNLKAVFELHPEVLPGIRILFLSNLHFFGSDIVIYQGETPRELRHIETVAVDRSGDLYFLSRRELSEFNRLVGKQKLQNLSHDDRRRLCQTLLLATWFIAEDLAFFSSWDDFRRFAFLSRAYKHAFSNFLWEGEGRGIPVVRGHTLTEMELSNDRRLREFWRDKAREEPAYRSLLRTVIRDDHNASLWLESLDSTKIEPLFHPPELEENPDCVVLLVGSSGEVGRLTRFIFEVRPNGEIDIKRLEQFPIPIAW
jgi:hypothetical protein